MLNINRQLQDANEHLIQENGRLEREVNDLLLDNGMVEEYHNQIEQYRNQILGLVNLPEREDEDFDMQIEQYRNQVEQYRNRVRQLEMVDNAEPNLPEREQHNYMALTDSDLVIFNSRNWNTSGVPVDSLGRNHADRQFITLGHNLAWHPSGHDSRRVFADIFIEGQYSRLKGAIFAHQNMNFYAFGHVRIYVDRGQGWEHVYVSATIRRGTPSVGILIDTYLGANVEHVRIEVDTRRGLPLILVDWEFYN